MKMGERDTWWTGARRSLAIGFDSGTGTVSLCCWSVAAYWSMAKAEICVFVKLFCQIFRGQLAPARVIRLVCVGKKGAPGT